MTKHAPAAAFAASDPIATSCTVEREPLLGALDLINRIVERRNTIPILSNVMLSPSDSGRLRLFATDLDLQLELEIDACWQSPGDFTVAAAALRDLVKKTEGGAQITLAAEDGRLTISAGRMRSRLSTLPVDDFPVIGAPAEGEGAPLAAFDIPSDQLASDLAALAPAMSSSEERYYLRGVAVQVTEVAGSPCLVMISTDGGQMVRIARPVPLGAEAMADAIIPRKAIAELLRLLKKREPAALAIEIGGVRDKVRVTGPGFRLTSKLVDGIYPPWPTAYAKIVGEVELQGVAMVELHPRLDARQIAALAKAAGTALKVETGEAGAVLTAPDYPEYLAVSMFLKEDLAPKGFGFNEYDHARSHAERYAAAVAEAAGIEEIPDHRHAKYRDGLIIGVTFGESEYVRPEPVKRLCYETFTEIVEYPEPYVRYADGAYSIPIPASHGALVTLQASADEAAVPVRTDARGAIQLSAELVRTLAGDPAEFERVDIAPLQFLHGEIVTGYTFPGVPKVATGQTNGRRHRAMTDREQMMAYCADPVGFMGQISAKRSTFVEFAETVVQIALLVAALPQPPEPPAVVEPVPVAVPDPMPVEAPADLPQDEPPAVEAPVDQPDAFAALMVRVARLEAQIAAQGIGAAAGEISLAADPRQDPVPVSAEQDREDLETIIAALRADNAAQAMRLAHIEASRARLGRRLLAHRGELAHERGVNAQLLGQIGAFLKHRPDPAPVPIIFRSPDAGPPDPATVIGYSFDQPDGRAELVALLADVRLDSIAIIGDAIQQHGGEEEARAAWPSAFTRLEAIDTALARAAH